MGISKENLKQYKEILLEIEKIREDIRKTEDSIAKLIEEGVVQDKVKGGFGGEQGFKIEGFPEKAYKKRRILLMNKKAKLIQQENKLLEVTESIEEFIDTLPTSRDRLVFRGIYLEHKTQQELAKELYVDRSLISKILTKYS